MGLYNLYLKENTIRVSNCADTDGDSGIRCQHMPSWPLFLLYLSHTQCIGSKDFPFRVNPFLEGTGAKEGKQDFTNVVSLVTNGYKCTNVSNIFECDQSALSSLNFWSGHFQHCIWAYPLLSVGFYTKIIDRLGPFVQSIVSLTSSSVLKMLIIQVSTISTSQLFLLKKCE